MARQLGRPAVRARNRELYWQMSQSEQTGVRQRVGANQFKKESIRMGQGYGRSLTAGLFGVLKLQIRFALRIVAVMLAFAHVSSAVEVAAQALPPATISPLELQPDLNQVNMVNGQIRVPLPTLEIPAAPRLRVVQLQDAMPYLIASVGAGSPVESSVSVHYGQGSADTFSCANDDVCTNRKANGSKIDGAIALGGPYVITRGPEGAVYSFDRLSYDSGTAAATRKLIYYVSSVAYPDGETLSYTYETANYASGQGRTLFRVTRISSSVGYYVTFSYQGSDANQNNWSAVAKASVYKTGSATTLSQLTYSASGTITDLARRVYTCTGCDFRVGGQTEYSSIAVKLPGETTPAISATPSAFSYFGLVTGVNRDGVNWTYSYNNFRQNSSSVGYAYDSAVVSGPNGYKTTYTMRVGTGWLPNVIASVTDALGRSTSYTYDSNNRIIGMTMPEGNSVSVTYDKWGNVITRKMTPKPGSGLTALTQSAAIDAAACAANQVMCYRITSTTDARNAVTTYAYDSAGRLIQQTDPADSQGRVRVRYQTYGASYTAPVEARTCFQGLTCGTTAEIKTRYTYLGQTALPLTETRIDGVSGVSLVTTFSYDAAGRLISRDGPLTGTSDASYFRYDAVGRRTWEIDAAGPDGTRPARRFTFRASDDKVAVVEVGTIANSTSTSLSVISRVDTTFDGRRNPVRAAQSAGGTVQAVMSSSFEDRGLLICAAVRMNPAAFATAPADACTAGLAGIQGADRITRNIYDTAGQLIQVRKAVGTAEGNADATYSYTRNGKRQFVIDGNGNRAQFVYDGFDRVAQWTFPSTTRAAAYNPGLTSTDAATVAASALGTAGAVNAADYEQYGYDANSNRTSFRKRDGSLLTYNYDALNRVIAKIVPERVGLDATHTRDVYYGYDVQDRPAFARFDSATGQGVTNTFDGFGRLTANTLNMDASWVIGHGYDAHNNVASTTFPDGNYVTYSYDALDRPMLIQRSGTATVASYSYDAAGRRSAFNGGVNTGYGYDAIGRLTSLTNNPAGNALLNNAWTFAYNPASQITQLTRSNDAFAFAGVYNVNRPYTTNGLNQYTAAGAASFQYDRNGNLTNDGSTSLTYDVENRLVAASGGKTASLRYDPLGRLYEVTGTSGTTRFVWDGDALLAEYNGAGTLLRRYIHGADGKADDPIAWYEGSAFGPANERILRPDWQGSIALVTDSAGANALAINTYDEWGIPGTNNQGRFQYTGQAWIAELGMYHYKARFYSATLGRFLQTDPIGYADQINLYGYVGNDPVDGVDPTGLIAGGQCTGSLITASDGACRGGGFVSGSGSSTETWKETSRATSKPASSPGVGQSPASTSRAPFTLGENLGDAGVNAVGLPEERLDHIVLRHGEGLNERTGKPDSKASIFYNGKDKAILVAAILKPALSNIFATVSPNTGGRPGLIVRSTLPYAVGITGYTKQTTNTVEIVLRPALYGFGGFFGVYEVWTAYPAP